MWQKLNSQIDEKVEKGDGTWIDWQYLKDASNLLLKVHIRIPSSVVVLNP